MAGSSYKGTDLKNVDQFLTEDGLDSHREKEIGQHIGYRYDVNLVPDYDRMTPFLQKYIDHMGWDDLNWLEDVHMGYEEGVPAVFDRNINGWVKIPERHGIARQPAGPRHAGARVAGQIPDVAEPSDRRARQGLSEVLSEPYDRRGGTSPAVHRMAMSYSPNADARSRRPSVRRYAAQRDQPGWPNGRRCHDGSDCARVAR